MTSSFGVLAADVTAVSGSVNVTNLTGLTPSTRNGTTATFTGPVTRRQRPRRQHLHFFATTTSLDGGITVTYGDGNDDFTTDGTTFTVGTPEAHHNLTIPNGTGAASNDQTFGATTHTVNGNLSVTGGAGDDDLTVDGTNFIVRGNVTVSTGTGGGSTDISPNLVLNVDGAVIVTAAEGVDTLAFNGDASVDLGSVRLTSGNGTSTLTSAGPRRRHRRRHPHPPRRHQFHHVRRATDTINGAITVTHGDGADTSATWPRPSSPPGPSRSGTGTAGAPPGSMRWAATRSRATWASSTGTAPTPSARGGASFTLGSATARRNLTIPNGNGDSATKLIGTTTTVNGSIAVTNGDGSDTFTVGGTAFTVTGAGNVTIGNGVGGGDTKVDAGAASRSAAS